MLKHVLLKGLGIGGEVYAAWKFVHIGGIKSTTKRIMTTHRLFNPQRVVVLVRITSRTQNQ